MKLHICLLQLVLLIAWVGPGRCRPVEPANYTPGLNLARDLQPVGSATFDSSTITASAITLSKEVNTPLGVFVLLLTAGTYWLLMRYTTTLSTEIILPSKLLETNIAAVLSVAWPKYCPIPHAGPGAGNDSPKKLFRATDNTIRVFAKNPLREVLGYLDVPKSGMTSSVYNTWCARKSFMVPIKIFSSIMKSLVQIAVWNFISVWLVLVMLANTIIYNGFASNNITNDSILRLVLVGIYAIANIGHQFHMTKLIYRNFTWILFQTCWTIICKDFLFVEGKSLIKSSKYVSRGRVKAWTSLNLELFGTTERSNTYRHPLENSDEVVTCDKRGSVTILPLDDKRRWSHITLRDKTESKFDKFVKPIREAEIKAYEKAAESALEKMMTNIAILLGICLATTLAPWTSLQISNATIAQLGSYALLLSVSTGFLALVGSLTQFTNATESAKTLLRLQEKTIEAPNSVHESEDVSIKVSLQKDPDFGFSKGIKDTSNLSFFRLWWSTSFFGKIPCLLFGPALMLIPRFHRARKNIEEGSTGVRDAIFFRVQGIEFFCRTSGPEFGKFFRIDDDYRPPPNIRPAYEPEYLQIGKPNAVTEEDDEDEEDEAQVPENTESEQVVTSTEELPVIEGSGEDKSVQATEKIEEVETNIKTENIQADKEVEEVQVTEDEWENAKENQLAEEDENRGRQMTSETNLDDINSSRSDNIVRAPDTETSAQPRPKSA